MEHIYVIETKCKHTLRWRFEEIRHRSEYGNGRYVIIVDLDTRAYWQHQLQFYNIL